MNQKTRIHHKEKKIIDKLNKSREYGKKNTENSSTVTHTMKSRRKLSNKSHNTHKEKQSDTGGGVQQQMLLETAQVSY